MSKDPLGGDTFADLAVNSKVATDNANLAKPTMETVEEVRARAAAMHAERVGHVRIQRAGRAINHLASAEEMFRAAGNRRMTDEDYRKVTAHIGAATRLIKQDETLRKAEHEFRREASIMVKEVDPYGKGSEHSWICDALQVAGQQGSAFGDRVAPGAEERLARHGRIVARAVDRGTKYGRAIEAQYVQAFRQVDVERNRRTIEAKLREFRTALTTGGGATASSSGGGVAAFVTPAVLLNQYAIYRSPRRVLADQLNRSVALPAYGMQVYVPQLTAGTTVATATEGSSTSEGDPTMAFMNAPVVEKTGQVTLSRAVMDRVGPGITADMFIFAQLKDQLGAQIDLEAATVMIDGAATVSDSGSFAVTGTSGLGTASMAKDVVAAKAKLTDTAGVAVRGTHLFAADKVLDTVVGWADAEGRPLLPFVYAPQHAVEDKDGDGYVAHMWQLACYADDTIPTSSSDEQVIVTRPSLTLLMESAPQLLNFPQFGAATLDPVLTINEYVAVLCRYPTAVCVISGSAYATSNFS